MTESESGAARFFDALYPLESLESAPLGTCLSLWDRQTKGSIHVDIRDRARLVSVAAEIDALGHDAYVGVGARRPGLAAARRGKRNDVVGIPGLWLDVDVAGPTHAAQNLPPTQEAALELLEKLPRPPSLLVDSGSGGFHCYWLFSEGPWWFRMDAGGGEEDRVAAERLVRGVQQRVREVFEAAGFHLDQTADLPRVLRVPGTRNWKVAQSTGGLSG